MSKQLWGLHGADKYSRGRPMGGSLNSYGILPATTTDDLSTRPLLFVNRTDIIANFSSDSVVLVSAKAFVFAIVGVVCSGVSQPPLNNRRRPFRAIGVHGGSRSSGSGRLATRRVFPGLGISDLALRPVYLSQLTDVVLSVVSEALVSAVVTFSLAISARVIGSSVCSAALIMKLNVVCIVVAVSVALCYPVVPGIGLMSVVLVVAWCTTRVDTATVTLTVTGG